MEIPLKQILEITPQGVTVSPALERFCALQLSAKQNWRNARTIEDARAHAERFVQLRLKLYQQHGSESSPGYFTVEAPNVAALNEDIAAILSESVDVYAVPLVTSLDEVEGQRIAESMSGSDLANLRWLVTITEEELVSVVDEDCTTAL